MSINQIIQESLKEFVDEKIYPLVAPEKVSPEKYIVYNPSVEEPGYYADDEDMEWVHHMQIHLYVRGNYVGLRKRIRSKLKSTGFTVTGIETFYEKETGYYHLCFECYIEEE